MTHENVEPMVVTSHADGLAHELVRLEPSWPVLALANDERPQPEYLAEAHWVNERLITVQIRHGDPDDDRPGPVVEVTTTERAEADNIQAAFFRAQHEDLARADPALADRLWTEFVQNADRIPTLITNPVTVAQPITVDGQPLLAAGLRDGQWTVVQFDWREVTVRIGARAWSSAVYQLREVLDMQPLIAARQAYLARHGPRPAGGA